MRSLLMLLVIGVLIFSFTAEAKGAFIPAIVGGITADGGTGVMAGGRLEFAFNKYFIWGIEAKYVHVTGANGVGGGLVMEYHIVPGKLPVVDPYLVFGGGFVYARSGEGNDFGGSIEFGGGMDLEPTPNSPVIPFFELGAAISMGIGDTHASFLLQGGIKFNL